MSAPDVTDGARTRRRDVAHLVTSRWGALAAVVVALVAAGLLIGGWGQATRTASATDQLPVGSDSATALELRERLPRASGSVAVVVFTRDSGLTATDDAAVRARAAALPGAGQAPPQRSEDGTAAIVVVPVGATDNAGISSAVAQLRQTARAELPDGLIAQVTGPAAVQADLGAVFEGADLRLLMATASIVALLLVITYRSPILWLVPLAVVGTADQVAAVLATHTLSVTGLVWDESTVGILSVLVFGAGTDYALLLISRYRDELRRHEDRREAMAVALRRTAEAVLSSAATVVVGLLTLLLSLFPSTRGLGLACAVGVVVACVGALVVLPAALVCLGRWAFWPRVPRPGQETVADGHSLWRRVGDRVAGAPGRVVAVTLVTLALMSAGLFAVKTGLSPADQFLEKPEAIAASERLARSFPAGSADPAVIVTTADGAAVAERAGAVDGVATARVVRSGAGVAEVDAVLEDGAGTPAASATVQRLRAELGGTGETHVAGTVAESLDQADAAARDRGVVLPTILGLVLLALVGLLRSLVAPVVLVATVVTTYLASLGVSWWLYTGVFGFEALDSSMPLLAFVFLVALGVDYNIFLVSRAREEARTHGTREGLLRGLTATGGVITSAGVLLAAVFAVLGVLPLVVLAQLGVVICVGVLLDTLVVRTVLVPALALLLGDRFWWPGRTPGAGPITASTNTAQTLDKVGPSGVK